MDPLSCLSIAGAVVQFLDFGTKLISESWKIYKDGELEVHVQAAVAARDLRSYNAKLRQSLRAQGVTSCSTQDEAALEELCRDCSALADEFILRLEKLKVEKGHVWKSLSQAISSIWKKQELAEIQQRLSGYMNAINTRILGGIR
jgi:plasmid maintenance system antidote protein VapI